MFQETICVWGPTSIIAYAILVAPVRAIFAPRHKTVFLSVEWH